MNVLGTTCIVAAIVASSVACAADPPPPVQASDASIVAEPLNSLTVCGSYNGPDTAILVILGDDSGIDNCTAVSATIREFVGSSAARSGSGQAVVDGWDCQAYDAVEASATGHPVVCTKEHVVARLQYAGDGVTRLYP